MTLSSQRSIPSPPCSLPASHSHELLDPARPRSTLCHPLLQGHRPLLLAVGSVAPDPAQLRDNCSQPALHVEAGCSLPGLQCALHTHNRAMRLGLALSSSHPPDGCSCWYHCEPGSSAPLQPTALPTYLSHALPMGTLQRQSRKSCWSQARQCPLLSPHPPNWPL